MTRAEAKKMLISFGIEEPTDQQITSYLDSVSGEVQKEKTRADGLKEKAEKADELKRQLDEIEQQNMSELEKEKKRAEAAEALAAERAVALTMAKVTSVFAEAGMVGDTYKGAIKAFSAMAEEDAIKEATAFVNGISESKKTALETAKSEWEAEKLKYTPNPGGGADPNKKDDKESPAAKYARERSAVLGAKVQQSSGDEDAPANF